MQLRRDDRTFPYPTMFLVSSRAASGTAPPHQAVGVLIAKQTLLGDGTVDRERQSEILTTDVEYAKPDPAAPGASPGAGPGTNLDLRFENDLAPTKPALDIVAVRDSDEAGHFGSVQIKRFGESDFGGPLKLDYGWRSRAVGLRLQQAGDVGAFKPDPQRPFELPNNFQNGYFNGSHLADLDHLRAGDVVEYTYELLEGDEVKARIAASVTVPEGPKVAFRIGEEPISPPVPIDLDVDTVIYDFRADDPGGGQFLITWRGVFDWDERLADAADAVLEVS